MQNFLHAKYDLAFSRADLIRCKQGRSTVDHFFEKVQKYIQLFFDIVRPKKFKPKKFKPKFKTRAVSANDYWHWLRENVTIVA